MAKSKFKSKKKIRISKSLNPLREKLNILTSQANERVKELREAGLDETSRALSEAQRTAIRFHSEDQLFTANLPRSRDIGREMARVQAFLNDITSTPEGVIKDADVVSRNLFGAQYRIDGGYGADPTRVSKETAERVFEIYHKALEAQGGYERVMGWIKSKYSGVSDYGSENLINKIYDMVIKSDEFDSGELREQDLIDDYAIKASKLIEELIEEAKQISELQQLGEDYGILSSKEREQRLKTAIWRRDMDNIERKWEDEQKNW